MNAPRWLEPTAATDDAGSPGAPWDGAGAARAGAAGPRGAGAGSRRPGRRRRAADRRGDGCRDAARPRGLCGLEVHQRLAVVEDCAELVVLRVGEVALGLDHFVVRAHAHLELALCGIQPPLRQLTCDTRRLHTFERALYCECGVSDVRGYLQLERFEIRLRLIQRELGPRDVGLSCALPERERKVQLHVPRREVETTERIQRVEIP